MKKPVPELCPVLTIHTEPMYFSIASAIHSIPDELTAGSLPPDGALGAGGVTFFGEDDALIPAISSPRDGLIAGVGGVTASGAAGLGEAATEGAVAFAAGSALLLAVRRLGVTGFSSPLAGSLVEVMGASGFGASLVLRCGAGSFRARKSSSHLPHLVIIAAIYSYLSASRVRKARSV